MANNIIALIPARSGSSRISKKNIIDFYGHPLIAYTIQQAKNTGIFERIIISSDSRDILNIAEKYQGEPLECPLDIAHKDNDKDIQWIKHALINLLQPFPIYETFNSEIDISAHALNHMNKYYKTYDYFAILRVTNPFRRSGTIKRAWQELQSYGEEFDSLKAYIPCDISPYKTFEIKKYDDYRNYMEPIMKHWQLDNAYTCPTQLLQDRTFGWQAGFLDICKWDNIEKYDNHFGKLIVPFAVDKVESWDINTELDLFIAKQLVEAGRVKLIPVK